MGADLSRVRFDALRDHSGVVLQQGRLLLDADWNELVAIVDRRLRAGAVDLGSRGPQPGIAGVAFVPRTTPDAFLVTAGSGGLTIGRGRMYVDGLVAENHGTGAPEHDAVLSEVRRSQDTPYDDQPYWPKPLPPPAPTAGAHLVYLDVWQREVTHLEAPDLIEQAVGVDTTARTQTVWQVRFHAPDTPGISCTTPDADVPGWADVIAPSAGRLTTDTIAVDDTEDLCALPPTGGYRGLENQTYRVEIHEGGPAGTATFKWSRDNGSVASPVVEVAAPWTSLRPASLGRDSVLRFSTGDWVEITDDHRDLNQQSGEMRRITVHEEDGTISFTTALPTDLRLDAVAAAAQHLRIRRWDQNGQVKTATGSNLQDLALSGSPGVITVPTSGAAVVLEHGLTAHLRAPGGQFHVGDHWVFAARTSDTSVEELIDAPPLGIHHHYARLGTVTPRSGATDCRIHWPPECGGGGGCSDCTVCVTAESHNSGALTIQEAIELVTPTGGTVCLEAGLYHVDKAGLTIDDATSVTVRGQGPKSLILFRGKGIQVSSSAFVTLQDFAVAAIGTDAAVSIHSSSRVTAQRLTVLVLGTSDRGRRAFELSGVCLLTRLHDNVVLAQVGVSGGDEERALLTAGLEISDNLLVCADRGVALAGRVAHLFATAVTGNTVLRASEVGVRAIGAIGPGGGCEISGNTVMLGGVGVEIAASGFVVSDNEILGTDESIKLGRDGVVVGLSSFGSLRGRVAIEDNRIRDVGGVGVAIAAPIVDLDVIGNHIERASGGVVMSERARALRATVADNVVRDVGSRETDKSAGSVGVQVVGARRGDVRSNIVHGVGTHEAIGDASVGIRVFGCLESRVSGNSVERVGHEKGGNQLVGIHVGATFARTLVDSNFSRRSPHDVEDEPMMGWIGLLVGGAPRDDGTTHVAGYTEVPGAESYVVGARTAFAVDKGGTPSATVDTNTVTGGGETPAALIAVRGEAVVSGNQCHQRQESAAAALELYAVAATVSHNRLRGGRPSGALNVDIKALAVVGNISSNGIEAGVPLGGLGLPWKPLNPDGV